MSQEFNMEADNMDSSKYSKKTVLSTFENKEEIIHHYDDAIELAGNGKYNIGLLITLILMTVGVSADIFGFSVVVLSSVCELKFDHKQTSFLMSVPFLGPIIMAYVWGYISDTRGRKKSLLIATFFSFVASIIGAFSTDWIMLGFFKFLSTSFSSCAQSVTYTLMSESCSTKVKESYIFIITSSLFLAPCFYYYDNISSQIIQKYCTNLGSEACDSKLETFGWCLTYLMSAVGNSLNYVLLSVFGYFILNLEFSLDIGYITFTPWRLLALILASPFGISCLALIFFYESPKFLLNAGYETEALELLKRIYYRNGGEKGTYPVKKVILNEEGSVRTKNVSLLKSLWEQVTPLFKPPLLMRTLQLYYLTVVLYSTNNSFFMWYPFLVKAFFEGSTSLSGKEQGLCSAIIESQSQKATNEVICDPSFDLLTCVSTIIPSFLCGLVNLMISKMSSRRKTLMLIILPTILICCVGAVVIENNVISFLLFVGVFFICLCISLVFSYFIDLYPTSHRGMVTCLSVMVARFSTLAGTNLVGAFIMDNCSVVFYAWSVYIFSAIVVACLLPPDRPKKLV